ncbi:MAG: hypothetical protein FWD55_07000, partial [Propionibacteriaceae bacterium]|nr:hypothetical protein [Propionibacteriaceae bacterium]
MVELPSLYAGVPAMQTYWQVKSSGKKMTKHVREGSEYLHLSLGKKTIDALRESARKHDHFYLAFAHNSTNEKPADLLRRVAQERFDWYCVDLSQQLTEDGPEGYIEIPEQNRLNLSTFSLLWSSLWVERFYSPLSGDFLIELPTLQEQIRLVYPGRGENPIVPEDWNFLTRDMPKYEGILGKEKAQEIIFPLGLGYALKVIEQKLYSAASELDAIQNYCPESLYGTANLWLFARSYHGFMEASGLVVKQGSGKNVRILPLPDDPENVSSLMKACLWHIVLLYASLDVEVRIIYRPEHDAGTDHSYYGGGIGYFPWLSLSKDGMTWMIENNVDATTGQHLDFIYEH